MFVGRGNDGLHFRKGTILWVDLLLGRDAGGGGETSWRTGLGLSWHVDASTGILWHGRLRFHDRGAGVLHIDENGRAMNGGSVARLERDLQINNGFGDGSFGANLDNAFGFVARRFVQGCCQSQAALVRLAVEP